MKDYFSKNYTEARKLFLNLAEQVGATVHSYCHDSAIGKEGEKLFTDVAIIGNITSQNKILFSCGVHGLEGCAGSSIESLWLGERWFEKLPPDSCCILVHAVNPWGFSHFRRTNENNVDLNRNFNDFPVECENHLYPKVHAAIDFSEWTEENFQKADGNLKALAEEMGWDQLINAIMMGQFREPEGFEFGGRELQWSSRIFKAILDEHVLPAKNLLFIDWHTGLGDYGKVFCVHPYPEQLQKMQLLAGFFGEDILDQGKAFIGGKRPMYKGVMIEWMDRYFNKKKVESLGMVVEIGTKDNLHLKRSLLLDRWVQVYGKDQSQDRIDEISKTLLADFYPDDSVWRNSLQEGARVVFDQAILALTHLKDNGKDL